MKLLSTVLPLAALASAFDIGPGAKQQRRDRLRTQMKRGEPCNVGQIYCLDQVVYELGVGMQDILHQYCDQQYTIDALSCHACKKFPTPAPECAAAYPAWNSAFTCEGNNQYTFAKRCDEWCAGGECVPKP